MSIRIQDLPAHKQEEAKALLDGTSRRGVLVALARDMDLEKVIEARGDELMLAFGFEVVRLSQRRASKVTAGLPDRLYCHRARKLIVWWEAKTLTGAQRKAQKNFDEMISQSGGIYLLGTNEELASWLVDVGIAEWDKARPLMLNARR